MLGQALGIADGIQHKHPTAVAVNAVLLGVFVTAQFVPVVGELVDAALLAQALVDGWMHYSLVPPPRWPERS